MVNTSIRQLSEFLDASGVQWYVYDLSRRVSSIPKDTFKAIEYGKQPFPTPRQGHAWLALLFWQPVSRNGGQPQKPFLWFIKLPLDERGIFQHANLQHFMSLIVDALGQQKNSQFLQANQEQLLKQNPYIFQPDESRRAALHAKISATHGFEPSSQFKEALSYLTQADSINWRTLDVQSLHDVAVRCIEPAHKKQQQLVDYLAKNFILLPKAVQTHLIEALEQIELPDALQAQWLKVLRNEPSAPNIMNYLRCLSRRADDQAYSLELLKIIQEKAPKWAIEDQKNLLLLIAARAWESLSYEPLFYAYMNFLAEFAHELFPIIFKELVRIAQLRPLCLTLMTRPASAETVQTKQQNKVSAALEAEIHVFKSSFVSA